MKINGKTDSTIKYCEGNVSCKALLKGNGIRKASVYNIHLSLFGYISPNFDHLAVHLAS